MDHMEEMDKFLEIKGQGTVWEAEISQAGCSLESEGQGDGVQPQPLLNGFYLLSPSPTAEPQEPSS